MKRFAIATVLLLLASPAFAANQNDQGTNSNEGVGVGGALGNQGNDKDVGNANGGSDRINPGPPKGIGGGGCNCDSIGTPGRPLK